jgi:hypothetical protein
MLFLATILLFRVLVDTRELVYPLYYCCKTRLAG